jgi:hypothetical protein
MTGKINDVINVCWARTKNNNFCRHPWDVNNTLFEERGMSFIPVLIIAKVEKPEWYKATSQFARSDSRKAFWQLATMRPGIPNYLLQECYEATPELQTVKPLTLAESMKSLNLNLYDEAQQAMISFKSLNEKTYSK